MAKIVKKRRGRPKGYSPDGAGEWREVFLAALQTLPNVRTACRKAGISRALAYKERTRSSDFADQWSEALQDGIDVIEATLMARAMKSDTTAGIFLLKNLRPEIYGENVNLNVTGSLTIEEVQRAQSSLNSKLDQITQAIAPGDRRLLEG
jgi:hypothetical protein